jgi:putative Ca2+/H+ antiporter (TMEM165/GDT1 family)
LHLKAAHSFIVAHHDSVFFPQITAETKSKNLTQVDNLNKKMSGKGNSVENLSYSSSDGLSQSQADVSGKSDASKQLVNQLFTSIQFWKSSKPTNTPPGPLKKATSTTALTPPAAKDSKSVEEGREDSPEQPQTSKQKFLALLKIFVNTFGLIFIAEWGDRSQLATIVLASVNNVGGIILGAIVGHVICTSLAVIAGALVARWRTIFSF